MRVRKAVIPAAGLGTRFLPATKAQPKEMLSVVDKPAVQYVVEEAVRSGIEQIVVVTGRGKVSLEDHFDRSWELESVLERKGDQQRLKELREIAELANLCYVRQQEPLGLGHAILAAEPHLGGEPFAVLLGDDLIGEHERLLPDMIDCYERWATSIVATMRVPMEQVSAYGVVTPGGQGPDASVVRVRDVVEKPSRQDAPSDLAIIGRYVLSPEVFDALRTVRPDTRGEIQLTDALRILGADTKSGLFAMAFAGTRYDIGDKGEFLRATIELACQRPDLGPGLRTFLRELVANLPEDPEEDCRQLAGGDLHGDAALGAAR